MHAFLPYGRQAITDADVDAVATVLRSDFLTAGPLVERFEHAFADAIGAPHAVAVSNATAALHVAVAAAGIRKGDRVVTSPNTFLASANCAAYVGATPDFSDIDPVSYNLDPAVLERSWKPDTRAVVAVDYAGQSCDMPAIAAVARKNGALVIEDACHGVGGAFVHDGAVWKVGSHPWADMTIFSFHPVKTMTTGEGGMIVTANGEWADRMRRLRSHGIVRNADQFSSIEIPEMTERGPWYHEMQDLGFNYRLTDLQCALGISQLARLPEFIKRRRDIVSRYNSGLSGLSWLTTPGLSEPANRDHISWHLYTPQFDFRSLGKSRTQVMNDLRDKQIGTQVLYIPVHLQPWYRKTFGYAPGKCPVAEAYYQRALSLPLFPSMSDDDVDRVIAAVRGLRTGG